MPSLIPKLLSSRNKEERLKRQDSKDDIRHSSKSARKEEGKFPSLIISSTSANKDEICSNKSGIRIFRRDNSREDVGRECVNSIKESAKGKQPEKQERTEIVGGAARSRASGEQSRTRCEDGKDDANDVEGLLSRREEAVGSIEPSSTVPEVRPEKTDAEPQDAKMIDMIIAENRTQDERMREQDTMVLGNEAMDEKHLLATREPIESVTENDKARDNDEEKMRDTDEQSLDVGSDGDVTGIADGERKGSLDIGYGKRLDEFQVVSEYACVLFVACGRNTRGRIRVRVCMYVCVEVYRHPLRNMSLL